MSQKKLKVYLEGDARSAEKAFDSVTSKADKLKSVLGTAFKVGAAAAGAALVAFGAVVKSTMDDLREIERIGAQTDAALKSTGGVAGVTRTEIEGLADALEKKSGVEAEAIQSGQNLLLTFTNIRNEAGEGNDIFNRTTGIMLDLSVAIGTDTTSAATMLGKALNDPIQGVTALQRVGVSFTDQQKEQIRVMQEGGDLMGAQKLILDELSRQYGGSAEALGQTLAGQTEIMKAYLGDFLEAGIAPMMPAIGQVTESLTAMIQGIDPAVLSQAFSVIGETLAGLAPLLGSGLSVFFELLAQIGPVLTEVIGRVGDIIMRIADVLVSSGILEVLAQIGEIIITTILDVIEALMPAIEAMAPIVKQILEYAANILKKIGPILGEIAAKLADIIGRILEKIEPYLGRIFESMERIWDAILPILPQLLDLAMPILELLLELIPPIMTLVEWTTTLSEKLMTTLGSALEWVIGAIQSFAGIWSSVWEAVKSAFSGIWDGIRWIYDNTIAPVVEVLKNLWGGLESVWQSVWSGLKGVVKAGVLGILKILKEVAYGMDLLDITSGGARFEGPIIRAIEAVEAWHSGGWIPGLGEIALPLGLFEGGEFVIPKDAAAKIGPTGLEAIRQGRVPAAGGDGATYHIHFHIPGFFGSQRELDGLARKLVTEHIPRVTFATGGTK